MLSYLSAERQESKYIQSPDLGNHISAAHFHAKLLAFSLTLSFVEKCRCHKLSFVFHSMHSLNLSTMDGVHLR